MKKLYGILSCVSIALSIISCVLCIITLSVVLSRDTAPVGGNDAPAYNTPVGNFTYNPQDAEVFVKDIVTLVPENGTNWHFTFPLHNDTDRSLALQGILVRDYIGGMSGQMLGEMLIGAERFGEIGLADENGSMIMQPGEDRFWDDWHPVVSDFDGRSYIFVFGDEKGGQVSFEYPFELSSDGAYNTIDYSADEGRDLITLRYDADFCVDVADGVQWVPVRTLGDSDYTNAQIFSMTSMSPEEKQAQIDTLYEAMQLYQVGGFCSSDDNIRIQENGINWEHHKPGFDAVRTNNGCCATSANWLNYILRGDYDEVGYIATSQRDGNGHIFNYIRQGEWYYIIDMTHYRTDWIATAPETGSMNDYYNSDFIAGNIHRVKDIQRYVDYVQAEYNEPPALMYMYAAEDCLAVDSLREQNGISIVCEKRDNVDIEVIYLDSDNNFWFGFADPPVNIPDWSKS